MVKKDGVETTTEKVGGRTVTTSIETKDGEPVGIEIDYGYRSGGNSIEKPIPWSIDFNLAIRNIELPITSLDDKIRRENSIRTIRDMPNSGEGNYASTYVSSTQAGINANMMNVASGNPVAGLVAKMYHKLGEYAITPDNNARFQNTIGRSAVKFFTNDKVFAFMLGFSNGNLYAENVNSTITFEQIDKFDCVGGRSRLNSDTYAFNSEQVHQLYETVEIYNILGKLGFMLGKKVYNSLAKKANKTLQSNLSPP